MCTCVILDVSFKNETFGRVDKMKGRQTYRQMDGWTGRRKHRQTERKMTDRQAEL